MYSANQIALYFISKSDPYSEENITNLKLQKLLYYAQGHYLVENHGNQLFNNRIEAWVHGPVVPDVYREYSHNNFNIINNDIPSKVIDEIDEHTREFLNRVWDNYKSYNGKELEYMTHQEDPWINIRGDLPEFVYTNDSIQSQDIHRYFLNHHSL